MEARINFTEVNNLVAILPARQKANYTFEVSTTRTEGTLPVVTKDLSANATTLKAAVKEAGQLVARLTKAYDPEYMMLFFYANGRCVGTMTISKDNAVIRCDFSGLAISNALAKETEEEPTEEPTTEEPTEESETLACLKNELQEYYNNESKGGKDRARNMEYLKEDIKKLEQMKETAIISLPKYYTETPERLRLLARNMADQYRGLKDPEAKRMKAIYLDIAGAPEYFIKNNLIKAI